jgi:hypothetical protein
MTMKSEGSGSRNLADAGHDRPPFLWQALSAIALLAMGGIHLYLVVNGVSGLAFAFILNAIGAAVLAVAILVLRHKSLFMACLLGLLFVVGPLGALLLALTSGLFGIREQLSGQLVVITLVVEFVGALVLAVTTAIVNER